jgi:hypothetical protein
MTTVNILTPDNKIERVMVPSGFQLALCNVGTLGCNLFHYFLNCYWRLLVDNGFKFTQNENLDGGIWILIAAASTRINPVVRNVVNTSATKWEHNQWKMRRCFVLLEEILNKENLTKKIYYELFGPTTHTYIFSCGITVKLKRTFYFYLWHIYLQQKFSPLFSTYEPPLNSLKE